MCNKQVYLYWKHKRERAARTGRAAVVYLAAKYSAQLLAPGGRCGWPRLDSGFTSLLTCFG